jgi:hypothetical protein
MAAIMYPFYRAIADRPVFSAQWSNAVIAADIDYMEQLLGGIMPASAEQSFAASGIGYDVLFEFPAPIGLYAAGTSIVPGGVQFTFEANVHRAIAKSVLPLYRKLALDKTFRITIAKGIRKSDRTGIARLVRGLVKTTALKRVSVEYSGITMRFKYAGSPYIYENMFFRVPF